jgi:hypothetical protein
MVAVTGELPPFVAVKDGILPVPLAANPIDGVLFVQLYTIDPPVVGLPKFTAVVEPLLQTDWLLITLTVAAGFTVIVKVVAVPLQVVPFVKAGVTVIVPVNGPFVVFVAVNAAIFPVPLAARPIAVLLFVQLYTIVPPVVGLLKATAAVEPPLQTTWLGTAFTVAAGLTVIVNVLGVPVQVTDPLV